MLFEDIENIECFVAEDGEHALSILDEFAIHAIVTDIKMPNIDGVELCKEVRANGFEGPIVVVTGEASRDQYRDLCQLGVSKVFEKPVDTAILKKEIQEVLDLETLKIAEGEILQSVSKQLESKKDYHELTTYEKVELLLSAIE